MVNLNLTDKIELPQFAHISLEFDEVEEALRIGRQKKHASGEPYYGLSEEQLAAIYSKIDLYSFDHIYLTSEEKEECYRLAREAKFFIEQKREYYKKVIEPVTFATMTAEELFEKYKEVFETFANATHERQIKQLCCYFANDPRFFGSLKKGILILGNPGNGKTSVMKFFAANQNLSFRVEAMLDLSFDYKMNGDKGITPFYQNFKAAPNFFGKEDYGFCFDDLGTEEIPCRHFGESKNIFSEILQMRYHHQLPFNSTHAISNKVLTSQDPNNPGLMELYGSRAYDRMKEMFNIIIFEHESFR